MDHRRRSTPPALVVDTSKNQSHGGQTHQRQIQSQQQKQKQQKQLDAPSKIVGLQNLHNSCYFNSVLQCLIQCQPLTSYFLSPSSSTTRVGSTELSTGPSALVSQPTSPPSISRYQSEKETVFRTHEKAAKEQLDHGVIASSYATFLRSIVTISHSTSSGSGAGSATNKENETATRNEWPRKSANNTNHRPVTATHSQQLHGANAAKTNRALQMSPIQFLQTVKKCLTLFNNYNQHDPHEFCSFFLSALHDDLNRCTSSNNTSHHQTMRNKENDKNDDSPTNRGDHTTMSIEFWKRHLHGNDSIIVDHFQGLLQNHIHCPQCSFTSTTFDIYSMLSLPIVPPSATSNRGKRSGSYADATSATSCHGANAVSIEECIAEFNKSNILDDFNTWFCPKCKDHVNAKQRIQLWTLPNMLMFHLKRFSNKEKKNQQQVVFPIETFLDMKPFVSGPTTYGNDASFRYKVRTDLVNDKKFDEIHIVVLFFFS